MQIIFFIIINIINVKLYSSYIIYPFKTLFSEIPDTDKNITLLFLSLIDNNIFIELNIGTPSQKIEVFLLSSTYNFYISEKNKKDDSELNKFFDKDSSKSL